MHKVVIHPCGSTCPVGGISGIAGIAGRMASSPNNTVIRHFIDTYVENLTGRLIGHCIFVCGSIAILNGEWMVSGIFTGIFEGFS